MFNLKNFRILILMLLCLSLLTACGADHKYVTLVKKGTMDMAPTIKIGAAFDDFFLNPEWKYFKSKSGMEIVEFNGECTWYNKPANCTIQFIIIGEDSFELGAISLDGINMTENEGAAILKKALTGMD